MDRALLFPAGEDTVTTGADVKEIVNFNSDETITSLELLEQINVFRKLEKGDEATELIHKNLLAVIRDEFEDELENIENQQVGDRLKIQPIFYKDSMNRDKPAYRLSFKYAKQVLVRESKFVRRAVIDYIEKLEQKLKEVNREDSLLLSIIKTDSVEGRAVALNDYLREVVTPLKVENQELKPKGAYFDALVDRNLLTNFRDTAKEFKIGQKDFVTWLMGNGYIYRDQKDKLKPYLRHVENGLFEIKEWKNLNKTGVQTLITPKGREVFSRLITL